MMVHLVCYAVLEALNEKLNVYSEVKPNWLQDKEAETYSKHRAHLLVRIDSVEDMQPQTII